MPRPLPKAVMTIAEVEQVLAQADVSTPLGLRDRAIMEVLYGTGIRRSEVTSLKLFDIDKDRMTLMVREGKGGKDRLIPIGERTLAWVDKYTYEVRHRLVVGHDEGWLFLTEDGHQMSSDGLSAHVARYVDRADIGKKGSCHMFRHTMATLMLENGADLRSIQEMLGHAQLSTTQIYTRIAIGRLQQVHQQTHPGAKLDRPV